jgi:hypothetical protein
MLLEVAGKLESLNGLIRSLPFIFNTFIYFGITNLPARSTLADANRNKIDGKKRRYKSPCFALVTHINSKDSIKECCQQKRQGFSRTAKVSEGKDLCI